MAEALLIPRKRNAVQRWADEREPPIDFIFLWTVVKDVDSWPSENVHGKLISAAVDGGFVIFKGHTHPLYSTWYIQNIHEKKQRLKNNTLEINHGTKKFDVFDWETTQETW